MERSRQGYGVGASESRHEVFSLWALQLGLTHFIAPSVKITIIHNT